MEECIQEKSGGREGGARCKHVESGDSDGSKERRYRDQNKGGGDEGTSREWHGLRFTFLLIASRSSCR